MATKGRQPRKRLSSFEARARVVRQNSLFRVRGFGVFGFMRSSQPYQGDLSDGIPEPDEELEDSDLSDRERREAIERERWRREQRQ